jgi:hypothetical protein
MFRQNLKLDIQISNLDRQNFKLNIQISKT